MPPFAVSATFLPVPHHTEWLPPLSTWDARFELSIWSRIRAVKILNTKGSFGIEQSWKQQRSLLLFRSLEDPVHPCSIFSWVFYIFSSGLCSITAIKSCVHHISISVLFGTGQFCDRGLQLVVISLSPFERGLRIFGGPRFSCHLWGQQTVCRRF